MRLMPGSNLLLAVLLAAAVAHAAPACPGSSSTSTVISQAFNNVTTTVGESLLIVKTSSSVSVPTLNSFGQSTSAPEFLSGEGGDPTVTAKFDVPNGACAELLLPVGFPLLQLFADSGARLGFAVNGTSLTLKANGGGTVYSNDALDLDSLNLFSDGPGKINLPDEDNMIESLTLFANGASSQFIAGTVDKVVVTQMNGLSKVYIEEVLSSITINLADGPATLATKGSPGLKVTGKLQGASKVTIGAGTCQTATSGAASCTTGPVDVAAFSL